MKVLMFSLDPHIMDRDSPPGQRMNDYASTMDKLSIILLSSGGLIQKRGNLVIYPTSRNKVVSFLRTSRISFSILLNEKYDLITTQDPFVVPFIAYPLSILFHLPLQIQVHSTFLSPFWQESIKNTVYQSLARFFLTKTVCIRVVSKRIRASLIENLKIAPSKIFLMPIYTDTKRIANAKPLCDVRAKYPRFEFIILIASRLVKQKNIDLAIDAFKVLVKRYPGMGLIVVGTGSYEKILKEKSRGLENNIVFEGWSNDLPSYYKGADLFLLTSNYEGWAMTIIEAMAAGTAIIMTDVGCAGEVVKNGLNGVIIPIGDQDALVEEIETLYKDPVRRGYLANQGQKTVRAMSPHTWEGYLSLYKESLEHCIVAHKMRAKNKEV